MLSTATSLLVVAALAQGVSASCYYDAYGRYYCNNSGLSSAARIAIGVCVGVGVFVLFMIVGAMRRKKIAAQWAQHRPPPPIQMQQSSDNPYANNPPPPVNADAYASSSPYAAGIAGQESVPKPAASYTPGGETGKHNLASEYYGTEANPSNNNGADFADHSYEYEQAQANAANGGNPPPGYDTTASGYAPPSGPPPAHTTGQYAAPSGPPPSTKY